MGMKALCCSDELEFLIASSKIRNHGWRKLYKFILEWKSPCTVGSKH